MPRPFRPTARPKGLGRATPARHGGIDPVLLGTWLWVRLVAGRRSDQGDVPGWVMVTVMTAGLVVAVFAVFRDAIVDAVRTALDQVVSGTGE